MRHFAKHVATKKYVNPTVITKIIRSEQHIISYFHGDLNKDVYMFLPLEFPLFLKTMMILNFVNCINHYMALIRQAINGSANHLILLSYLFKKSNDTNFTILLYLCR